MPEIGRTAKERNAKLAVQSMINLTSSLGWKVRSRIGLILELSTRVTTLPVVEQQVVE